MGGSHSDPTANQETNSGYHHSYRRSSEPPSGLPSSRRERCQCSRRERKLEKQLKECAAKLEECEAKLEQHESLKIRLFHKLKEAKEYAGAEELYRETMTGRDLAKSEETVVLDLKYSFAEMLIEQKKFQEAEPISREVWEIRKRDPAPTSKDSEASHRQLCSVLCNVGKHKDAEYMQRIIYQKEPMDRWALENGDEVCQRLREQGKIQRAKEMQQEVWEERLKQPSPRDERTVRSGLCLIGFLEELVATIDQRGDTDTDRIDNASHKQAFECEIERTLRRIWAAGVWPESNKDILGAGHKLGTILLHHKKFPDAETIFTRVWEGRKQQFGDRDPSTLSTGSMLGKSVLYQRRQESYLRAVNILADIWLFKKTVMNNGDTEVMSIGEDLAHAYHSLRDWPNAEQVHSWIVDQKEQRGFPMQDIDDARWRLGHILYDQGTNKHGDAENIFRRLYQQWKMSSTNPNLTLQCGQMLAQSLSTQDGKANDALEVALDVHNRRASSAERGLPYLDSGHLCGSLLIKVENFGEAERILDPVWNIQTERIEEQKRRLECGHLYGQALAKNHKYSDARKILDTVAAGQEATLPAGSPEIAETHQLREKVQKEVKRTIPRNRRKGYPRFF